MVAVVRLVEDVVEEVDEAVKVVGEVKKLEEAIKGVVFGVV